MEVVILAGGLGTRLSEETYRIPKPLVQIGKVPIIVHLMQIYSSYGFTNFIIAGGYKFEEFQKYFSSRLGILKKLNWQVRVLDTGLEAGTAERLHDVLRQIDISENFFLTYGDGLADINIQELKRFHIGHGGALTVTAVRPPARFGFLKINNGLVVEFNEKDQSDVGWINGGFFVCNRSILDFIGDDDISLEISTLPRLVGARQMRAFEHPKWWHPMDTLRDKKQLEEMYIETQAPWVREVQELRMFDHN